MLFELCIGLLVLFFEVFFWMLGFFDIILMVIFLVIVKLDEGGVGEDKSGKL